MATSSAFSPTPQHSRILNSNKGLHMSSPVKVPITISGDNIDLTPALSDYVNQKVERTVGKLSSVSAVSNCDVFLTVNKNPKVESSHTAEVVTSIKGTTFRVAESSPDMYASIDLVANRLARKLRKYKERRLNGYHGGPNMGENLADVLNSIEVEDDEPADEEDESFIDPEQAVITKVKSFDLGTPISIKEAIFALDYIDHDFYVFRDEESSEVSVVYKRNAGGVGLIQPEQ
eukprot:CAMPEP_0181104272 /NCGR_PEP_ID=MMETSP1071-20121207/15331_1 /TAXON_ID=35127 /ORGANISM="Thalassiosira sp., Strain NH16" /LENGTH=231 /DNA_ID=CAMNT_0023187443 /DNA_START=102 /DNA_END=797 /DNA_ORIENTATION=-